jgi:hypothetical protein
MVHGRWKVVDHAVRVVFLGFAWSGVVSSVSKYQCCVVKFQGWCGMSEASGHVHQQGGGAAVSVRSGRGTQWAPT